MGLVLRAVRHLDTSCFDREPRALATGLSPRVLSMGGVAEVPAVSLAGWRFGTQRPRFFSVDYRPTEAHSRDLRTGHLRFLSGDHSTPITLRCHFHTEQSGYSTFRVFSFRLRPFYWPTLRDVTYVWDTPDFSCCCFSVGQFPFFCYKTKIAFHCWAFRLSTCALEFLFVLAALYWRLFRQQIDRPLEMIAPQCCICEVLPTYADVKNASSPPNVHLGLPQ